MQAKYQAIACELKRQIAMGKYAGATHLPAEFDLCQEYRVSRQTVRHALSLLVDEGFIERRQGSGSRILRFGPPIQNHNIAVVTTYISDYIFPGILREVERVLSSNGFTPLLFSTYNQVDNERRILTNLLSMQIDGILLEGSKSVLPNPNLDLFRMLMGREIPLVFVHSRYSNFPQALSVLDDNKTGGRQLVNYLYEKGHRNIAGIFKSDDMQGLERYAGYIAALRELDLPLNDRNVFWYDTAVKKRLEYGNFPDSIKSVLEGCTAVVCYNDEIAHYLVHELIGIGVKLPEEMAVVSFDNSLYSDLSPVRITSLSHGEYNVGRLSSELLLHMIEGEQCQSQTAPWVLMEKESG